MRSRQGGGSDGVLDVAPAAGNPARPPGDHVPGADRPPAAALAAAGAGRGDALAPHDLLRLQRSVGNAATGALLDNGFEIPSGGSPLSADVRGDMEHRFGTDFSDVRVHTDASAHASASSVDAQAYTTGNDIVFAHGNYDPQSAAGRHMLAHELTHVVQQRTGPVEGTDAGLGVAVSDPGDRHERDAVANADRVMSEASTPTASAPAAPTQSVQRIEDDSPAVQRATIHDHEHDELRDADQ
ncbi:eCIS core domain-containing protein [Jatrophihabitans fulvus]